MKYKVSILISQLRSLQSHHVCVIPFYLSFGRLYFFCMWERFHVISWLCMGWWWLQMFSWSPEPDPQYLTGESQFIPIFLNWSSSTSPLDSVLKKWDTFSSVHSERKDLCWKKLFAFLTHIEIIEMLHIYINREDC